MRNSMEFGLWELRISYEILNGFRRAFAYHSQAKLYTNYYIGNHAKNKLQQKCKYHELS